MSQVNTLNIDLSDLRLYNRKYVPLFENKSEFLHLYGSAGSGKSRFIAQKEIALTFDEKRRNRKTLVIRKVARTLKDSVYSELLGVIYGWDFGAYFENTKSPLSITNKLTGVQVLFIGLDDIEKVKSISGVDRIWIEEATELQSYSELEQLRLRLRGFDEIQITLSYNPIDEYHWLNKQIHETAKEGHCLFHSTYNDNEKLKALDPKYFEYLDNLEGNYARVYRDGLWGRVIEGLIYENWSQRDTFPTNDKDEPDVQFYGLDFGYSDPTALVQCHIQDASPKKKLIAQEILYKTGLDSDGLCNEFDRIGVRKDRQIIADNARPELIASLKKRGYKIKGCEKGTGSVLTGINKLRNYDINIVAGSKFLISEINNYQKAERFGQYIEDPAPNQADHALDALRYGIQAVDKVSFEMMRFRI